MHLGGHGSLGINPHTWICSLKFHPIINNNSGTHQIGKIGLLSTNILGFKDGGEDTTKKILKPHLSLCPTILILSSHLTLRNFCQVLFHHLYLLFLIYLCVPRFLSSAMLNVKSFYLFYLSSLFFLCIFSPAWSFSK
jgi:hypothetical protein